MQVPPYYFSEYAIVTVNRDLSVPGRLLEQAVPNFLAFIRVGERSWAI